MAAMLLSCAVAVPRALAKAPPKARESQETHRTRYDFDDDTVEGGFTRPEDSFVDPRIAAKHKSLIRLRMDFIAELLKSADSF